MGKTMLLGVLNMPPELWTNDPLDIAQRHSRYLEAAAFIEEHLKKPSVKYGCWVELNCGDIEGPFPDCVVDQDKLSDCTYACAGMQKEDCEHWRINDYAYKE